MKITSTRRRRGCTGQGRAFGRRLGHALVTWRGALSGALRTPTPRWDDRLAKAEAAWRDAAGAGLNVEGPKDTTPWGLLSWAISTGLLVVLNEKRKREAKAVLDAAKQESADVVARQDDAPFVGSGGKLEPEHRLADAPSRLDAVEAALVAAGVLKRP